MSADSQALTWRLALDSLQREVGVMLLYVLESKGSSPGRQGFFMVVNTRGEMEGSIGGGIMEHKFTEMARDLLRETTHEVILRKQVHDKSASKDRSGMICSGEQTILLLALSEEYIPAIRNILDSLAQFRNGTLQLSPAGLDFLPYPPQKDFYFYKRSEEDWRYEEMTGLKERLFIVGGGHCSLAFSRIMRMMDFHISVFDHRPDLRTFLRNEFAHEKIVVRHYDELRELIPSGPLHHYAVVMTLGYRTDELAVRALLRKQFRYFGLLGSQAKAGQLMADYREAGISEEHLQKVHTPAGLPIRSQTPEEIAVSIAAEIIRTKNENIP